MTGEFISGLFEDSDMNEPIETNMITKNIIEGLIILEKYRTIPDGYNTGAEHGQIYAYSTDDPVSVDDLNRLVELGWVQQEVENDDDDEFTAEHYDSDEGWSCYV